MNAQQYPSSEPQATIRRRLSRDEIEACALNLAQMDAGAQFDLLACIAGDFVRGIPIAQSEGMGPDCFHDDMKIIYSGFEAAFENRIGLVAALRVIKTALIQAHFWDDTEVVGNMFSCLWSDEKLATLTGLWFFIEDAIRQRSKKLLRIISLIANIRRLSRDLMGAYEDTSIELVGSASAPVRPQQKRKESEARWVGFLRSSRRPSAA